MAEDLKEGPLSLWRDPGTPNLGTISVIRALTTSIAFSVLQGKASTSCVKVPTRSYLHPFALAFG